ncbi:MAG: Fur family transcriptional regulator [Bacillota bacterium]
MTKVDDIFNQYDIRLTEPRREIFKILLNTSKPVSANYIHNLLKEKLAKCRLSTVYRNLSTFKKMDIIREINSLNNNKKLYEISLGNKHHHHLICTKCGEMEPLDCPLKGYEDELKKKTDYKIIDHSINIYGICPACNKNS